MILGHGTLLVLLMVLYAPIANAAPAGPLPAIQRNTSADQAQSPLIQSLTVRQKLLQNSVDRWNIAYVVALFFAIAIGAFTGWSQFKTIALSRELVSVQSQIESEKDRLNADNDSLVAADLKDKDLKIEQAKQAAAHANEGAEKAASELAGANARASEATARVKEAEAQVALANAASRDAVAKVAEAQRASSEASAKAEGFRFDIAKANERAAEANRIAEGERLARVKIEERLADRAINEAQAHQFVSELKTFNSQEFAIVTYWEDREPLAISQKLADLLSEAGWKINQAKEWTGMFGGITGISVYVHPESSSKTREAANKLVSALNSIGLGASLKLQNDPGHPSEKLGINVGTKPQ